MMTFLPVAARNTILVGLMSVLTLAVLAALALRAPDTHAQSSGSDAEPARPGKPVGTPIWSGMMDIQWNEVPGANSYEVQYFHVRQWIDLPSDDEGIELAYYRTTGAVARNLPTSRPSYLRVRAVNSHGPSEWSDYMFHRQTGSPNSWQHVPEPVNVPATGYPRFTGTVAKDETLTVDTSAFSDENGMDGVDLHYQWIASATTTDTNITGATEQSYTVTGTEVGDNIKVRVEFTDRHGFSESLTYDPRANVAATGAPTISGELRVLETLTADTSAIADENGLVDADFSYQWIAVDDDGGTETDIDGATNQSYELTSGELGKTVRVRVGFTDDLGYAESLTSDPTGTIVDVEEDRLGRKVKCPNEDDLPTPAALTVTNVPVEVGSTEDDYFVIYASFQIDSSTLEYPVQVALGENSTTTLAESVKALPASRYRVEKYLVESPGDVDGDCIDDVTELGDASGKNPVNSAPPISSAEGAASIHDRAAFERLSYQGRNTRFHGNVNDREIVAFWLQGMDTARPVVYFLNTEKHRNFYGFRRAIDFTYPEDLGPPVDVQGVIVYHPGLTAPDGSTGVYHVQFQRRVFRHRQLEFQHVAYAYGILAANMPLLDNNLMYHPLTPTYEREKALFDASRIGILLTLPNRAATGAPTISGVAQVRETLTAETAAIDDSDGLHDVTLTYEWLADDSASSQNATASTYVPPGR